MQFFGFASFCSSARDLIDLWPNAICRQVSKAGVAGGASVVLLRQIIKSFNKSRIQLKAAARLSDGLPPSHLPLLPHPAALIANFIADLVR